MLKDTSNISFDDLYHEIDASDSKPGITHVDILLFSPPLDTVFNTLSRKNSLTTAEFAIEFGLTDEEVKQLIDMLIDKGYLAADEAGENAEITYRINYARKKPRKAATGIWDTLDF